MVGELQALKPASVCHVAALTPGLPVGQLVSFVEGGCGHRSFRADPRCIGQVVAPGTVMWVAVENRTSMALSVAGRKSTVERTVIAARNAMAGQLAQGNVGSMNAAMSKTEEKADERSAALGAAGECRSGVSIAGQNTDALAERSSIEAQQIERWDSAVERGDSGSIATPGVHASTRDLSNGGERVFGSRLVPRLLE
jgi:hypothetical protein